jgi:transposase InsO family protein
MLSRDGNYRLWANQMRALLLTQNRLDEWLDKEPGEDKDKEKEKDMICKAKLQLHVTGPLQSVVARASTAKQAWDALHEDYVGSLRARAPQLTAALTNLNHGDESLVAYIDRVLLIRDQFEELNMAASIPLLTHAFIRGLRDDLRMACAPTLHTIVTEDGGNLDAVVSRLRSMVLLLPENCDKVRVNIARTYKEKRRCYWCDKVGHLEKDCRVKRRGEPRVQSKASSAQRDGTVLSIMDAALAMSVSTPKDSIWFDTGATHHVVIEVSMLVNVSPATVESLIVAGGERHRVSCMGDLVLRGGPSGPVTLTNVLCVPTMCINVMSGPAVTAKGVSCQIDKEKLVIKMKQRTLLVGYVADGMYRINCELPKAAYSNVAASANLWHRRLGHVSHSAIRKMVSDHTVIGLSNLEEEPDKSCDICDRSKQTRQHFPRSSRKVSKVLQLIHSDVLGPMPCEGVQGEKYVLTVLDDYSRFSEVVCLRNKRDVAASLIDVIARWQRQTGVLVKALRTDRGTEFMGQLRTYIQAKGIVHELSVAYVPEQNGRAERLNRTLLERTRALLLEHKLPKVVWSEAIKAASYLRNVVCSAKQVQTPYELFHGAKPSVSHLRVYGCKVSAHIPAHKRDKLDGVSEECVLVGYAPYSRAYRLLTQGRNGELIVVEAINVRIHEDESAKFLNDFQHDDEEHTAQGVDFNLLTVSDKTSGAQDAEIEEASNAGYNASETSEDTEETGTEDPQHVEEDPVEHPMTGDSQESAEGQRYPKRNRRPPQEWWEPSIQPQLNAVAALSDEPRTYREAMSRQDADLWQQAVNAEFKSLHEMGVYENSHIPAGKAALPSRLVFAIKRDEHGNVEKYKCRLVAKGFQQVAGKDYDEVFAPTAQHASLRILLAIAAAKGLTVDQIDVKTAFLNGELKEEVYLKLPDELGGAVWRLKKALYGLKQAARAWHEKLKQEMMKLGFMSSKNDPCLFFRGKEGRNVYVLVHVDDAVVIGQQEAVQKAKQDIATRFEIKDLGAAKYYLGLEIRKEDNGSITLSQEKYTKDLLARYDPNGQLKPKSTPFEVGLKLSKESGEQLPDGKVYRELVGALLYLASNTRPDISYAVSVLSRFMSSPTESHWNAAKRVLRYLKGTINQSLTYLGAGGVDKPVTFVDADFAADEDKRRSTSGMVVTLNGRAVMWMSKLQSVVATSTAEAEFISAATGVKEALWIRKLLSEITGKGVAVQLRCDNQSAIHLIKQNTAGRTGRSKHIDVQFHFLKDRFQRGDLEVEFVETANQAADMFTKQLPGPALVRIAAQLMGG